MVEFVDVSKRSSARVFQLNPFSAATVKRHVSTVILSFQGILEMEIRRRPTLNVFNTIRSISALRKLHFIKFLRGIKSISISENFCKQLRRRLNRVRFLGVQNQNKLVCL